MADKQAAADVPPQTSEDQQNPSLDSIVSSDDSDSTVAAANDSAENRPTTPPNATAADANAAPSDDAAPAAAAAAPAAAAPEDDGAPQAASNVSTTVHPHPILHDLLRATADLAKNMREISQYIVKCHNAFLTVEALDACIASSSSTYNSIQLVTTMLNIHTSVAKDIAADYDAEYVEYNKERLYRYYNLEQIYTSRSRYNLRHNRRRVSRRQRQRQQQQHPYHPR